MKKQFFKSLIISLTAITAVFGAVFTLSPKPEPQNASPIILEEAVTTSTTLKGDSRIFEEVTTDGIVSYLEINLSNLANDLKTLVITQTIGDYSQTMRLDELGNQCYYKDNQSIISNAVFTFTRPATYTVYYRTSTTSATETCEFAPSLNANIITNTYSSLDGGTTRNTIKYSNGNYFILGAGAINFPLNNELYTLTATSNGTQTSTSVIPNNAYGLINYKLKSKNGDTSIALDVYVITVDFSILFKNNKNETLINDDYLYLGGYVFNEGVTFELSVDSAASDIIGEPLTSQAIDEIFNFFTITLESFTRNETNSAYIDDDSTIITETINDTQGHIIGVPCTLPSTDNTTYNIQVTLENGETFINYKESAFKFKIITKVPVNQYGSYVFGATLAQGDYSSDSNFIGVGLNGYLTAGTTIYNSLSTTRIFNRFDNTASLLYKYNGVTYSILYNSPTDFTTDTSNTSAQIIENGSSVTFLNDTTSFDELFTFTINFKTYNSGYSFKNQMIENQLFYNGNLSLRPAADAYQELSESINSFKYVVPNGYSENGIPTFVRVTHNGTSFENIHALRDGDELEFTDYGTYDVEIYTTPSYDYLIAMNSSPSLPHYYYQIRFTIAGPSIKATTTNNLGETLIVSNNLYTQSTVHLDVNLSANQKFIAYLNGNEGATITESYSGDINTVGTWKICIYDEADNILDSLTFTIMDKIYQGFSINEKDEFLSLVVSKRTSDLPLTYEALERSNAYIFTETGKYRIEMATRETLNFKLNSAMATAYTVNSNTLDFEIAKSYFNLSFVTGENGGRISEDVSIFTVGGIELQSLEVYRNNKLVHTFTAEELKAWDSVNVNTKTFKDYGTYTLKLTDKFGNSYEAQIEKYYKVNVALIFLIIIAVAAVVGLVLIILKARRGVKVK